MRCLEIKQYKGYLIDLDGTVYNGTNPIPTAKVFVDQLAEKGIPHLFLTNNATRTPEEVVSYLWDICQIETTADHVYTSGLAAVDYIANNHAESKTYVVGEAALIRQMEAAGLELTNDIPDIDVVLQALDREATYESLTVASRAIRNGAAFIVTNPDTNIPTEVGLVPGSGSLTAFLERSTQQEPLIIGKPYEHIMTGAVERLGFDKTEVAMIGDNYNTDILAGINYGLDTILTLTGFTQREDLEKVHAQPTYIIENMNEWKV